jgi:hypothetical protein
LAWILSEHNNVVYHAKTAVILNDGFIILPFSLPSLKIFVTRSLFYTNSQVVPLIVHQEHQHISYVINVY